MARCQAITSKRSCYKDEYNGRCQSEASIVVLGIALCGTHLNQGFRQRLSVVTELPVLTDGDMP